MATLAIPASAPSFIEKLLAPLPAGEMPADTQAYRRQMADDQAAAADIASVVDHLAQLRIAAVNPELNELQRYMAGVVLSVQEEAYLKLRRA